MVQEEVGEVVDMEGGAVIELLQTWVSIFISDKLAMFLET